MNLEIRPWEPQDVEFAAECTHLVKWLSEDRTMLAAFLEHNPQGCLLARLDGRPAGICVATHYGAQGFIGELIVLPDLRGQGVGRILMEHAIQWLQACGARSLFLDGALKAVPLYERCGFRKVCRSLRFFGSMPAVESPEVRPMTAQDLPAVCDLDRRAFGADRSFFLHRRLHDYPRHCKVMFRDGNLSAFTAGRGGPGWITASPWIAEEGEPHPERLLHSIMTEAQPGDVLYQGVLECNRRGVEILRRLGLAEREDAPWRMLKGEEDSLGVSSLALSNGSAAKG